MEFRELVFVVDGLLAKGLILMAGASKIGKSWLALWLAHRISTGQDVWGFETRQCEVMYTDFCTRHAFGVAALEMTGTRLRSMGNRAAYDMYGMYDIPRTAKYRTYRTYRT